MVSASAAQPKDCLDEAGSLSLKRITSHHLPEMHKYLLLEGTSSCPTFRWRWDWTAKQAVERSSQTDFDPHPQDLMDVAGYV